MIRILVVEDEEPIRLKLGSMIREWGSGAVEIEERGSALAALESMSEGYQPEVLVTDVCMPGMSGLELIRLAREIEPGLPCIVVSGHADFEFAREAVSLGVTDYLLKPVKREDLHRTLDRARRSVRPRARETDAASLSDEAGFIRNQDMVTLLGNLVSRGYEEAQDPIRIPDSLAASGTSFHFFLFQVCRSPRSTDIGWLSKSRGLLHKSIQALFPDPDRRVVIMDPRYVNRIAVLHWRTGGNGPEPDPAALVRDQEKVPAGLPPFLASCTHGDIKDLPLLYPNCVRLLAERFCRKDRIFCQPAAPGRSPSACERHEMEQLLSRIHLEADHLSGSIPEGAGRTASIVRSLRQLATACFSEESIRRIGPANLRIVFIEFVAILIRLLQSGGMGFGEMLSEDVVSGDVLSTLDDHDQLVELLCLLIDNSFNSDLYYESGNLVDKTLRMIEHNYASPDLSLNTIADKLYVNASYLSRLFKKKQGVNLVAYIHQVRLRQARRMLKETRLDVADIADRTGYTNQQYFSRIFRKWMGMSPMDYRSAPVSPGSEDL